MVLWRSKLSPRAPSLPFNLSRKLPRDGEGRGGDVPAIRREICRTPHVLDWAGRALSLVKGDGTAYPAIRALAEDG